MRGDSTTTHDRIASALNITTVLAVHTHVTLGLLISMEFGSSGARDQNGVFREDRSGKE